MGGPHEKRRSNLGPKKPGPHKKHNKIQGQFNRIIAKRNSENKQRSIKLDESTGSVNCESSSSVLENHESSSSKHHDHESSSSGHHHSESSSSEHHHSESPSSEHHHSESPSSEHHHSESPSSEHHQHKSSSLDHGHHKCKCPKRKRRRVKCKNDCLCKLLRKFKHHEITITTKSGKVIKGELQLAKGCCVRILEPGSTSPFIPKRVKFIRCKDIESLSADISDNL